MKEELQGKLVEILTSIQTAAGKASDFAMEQLPDIAQSYIAYGRALTLVYFALGLLVFLGGFVFLWKANQMQKDGDAKYEKAMESMNSRNSSVYSTVRSSYPEGSDINFLAPFPFAIGLLVMGANMSQMLMVWFAPKVWLLKEIATMLR
jgi:hypothetical protein